MTKEEQDRLDWIETVREWAKWSSPIPQYDEMKQKWNDFVEKGEKKDEVHREGH